MELRAAARHHGANRQAERLQRLGDRRSTIVRPQISGGSRLDDVSTCHQARCFKTLAQPRVPKQVTTRNRTTGTIEWCSCTKALVLRQGAGLLAPVVRRSSGKGRGTVQRGSGKSPRSAMPLPYLGDGRCSIRFASLLQSRAARHNVLMHPKTLHNWGGLRLMCHSFG